jgi:hypothetical protein
MTSSHFMPAVCPVDPVKIYAWHKPTMMLPSITTAMSKKLGLHHNLVRAALGHEIHRVIGDVNSYTKVFPPISEEHRFTAQVDDTQWLKGTGLHQRFSDFIEALRDDLDLLRRYYPNAMGLYTTPKHIRKCCENDVFSFPIVMEADVQNVDIWRSEQDMSVDEMWRYGCVLSQGAAMILPEFIPDYLLPTWADDESIYIHQLPAVLSAYTDLV